MRTLRTTQTMEFYLVSLLPPSVPNFPIGVMYEPGIDKLVYQADTRELRADTRKFRPQNKFIIIERKPKNVPDCTVSFKTLELLK